MIDRKAARNIGLAALLFVSACRREQPHTNTDGSEDDITSGAVTANEEETPSGPNLNPDFIPHRAHDEPYAYSVRTGYYKDGGPAPVVTQTPIPNDYHDNNYWITTINQTANIGKNSQNQNTGGLSPSIDVTGMDSENSISFTPSKHTKVVRSNWRGR